MFTDSQSGLFQTILVFRNYYLKPNKLTNHYNPPEDVRKVFLDISKTFSKAWREGLLFKLKKYGFEGKLIMLLESYLKNRKKVNAK